MYRMLLLWPYATGSLFASIFCLFGLRATVFVDGRVPIAVVVLVFLLAMLLALACFRLAEPVIMTRMLRTAIRNTEACGGVVVRPSASNATTIANALIPMPSGYRARSARTDVAVAASRRLVMVTARRKLLLVTTRSRTFVEVPADQFRIIDVGDAGAIELQLTDHHTVAFGVVAPRRWGFTPMARSGVELALNCAEPAPSE